MRKFFFVILVLLTSVGLAQQNFYYRFNHYGIRADRGKFDSALTLPYLNYFPTLPANFEYGARQFSSAGSAMLYALPTDSTPAKWPYWYNGTKWFTIPSVTKAFDTACYTKVSGGVITRIGVTLCYNVTTVKFRIGCKEYTALADTVCLNAAPTEPLKRITIIYADTLGNISTRASADVEDPAKPSIDFTKEFELGFVLQENGAAGPVINFPNYIYFGINGIPYGSPNFRYDSVSTTMSIYGKNTGDRWDISGDYWYHSQASGAQRQEFLRRAGSNLTQAGGIWRFGELTVRPSLTAKGFDQVAIAQDEAMHTGIGWPLHKAVGLYTNNTKRFWLDSLGNAYLAKADTITGPTYVLARETGTNRLVSVLMQGSSTPYVDSLYKTGNTVFWQKNGNTYSFSDGSISYPNGVFYGKNNTNTLYGGSGTNFFYYDSLPLLTINAPLAAQYFIDNAQNTSSASFRLKILGKLGVAGNIVLTDKLMWEAFGWQRRQITNDNNARSLSITGDLGSGTVMNSGDNLNFIGIYDSLSNRPLVFTNPTLNQFIMSVNSQRRALLIPRITTARLNNMRYLYRQANGDYESNGYALQEGMIAFNTDNKKLAFSRDTGWVYLDAVTGGTYTASSLGTANAVYAGTVGNDFQFKSIKAGTNVTITNDANEITINAAGGGGTTETASNVGTGLGWYKTKIVDDLQFKSFKVAASSGTTLTNNTDDITINPNSWYITGNSDIVSGTNYLGTTNAVPIEFRYNNSMRGWLSNDNIFFGVPMTATTRSNTNYSVVLGTSMEFNAVNMIPDYTIAIGYNNFGQGTPTAYGSSATNNIAIGNQNFGFNYSGGVYTTQGSYNIGIGALNFNRYATGAANVGIGYNTTSWSWGYNNVWIGRELNYSGPYEDNLYTGQGIHNVAIGVNSLGYGIATDYNTILGTKGGTYFTDADNNLVIGTKALWGELSGPMPNLLDNASWSGTGWSAGANNYTWTHTPGNTTAKVNTSLRAHRYMLLEVKTVITGRTAGSVTLRFGNVYPAQDLTYSANGTFTSGGVNLNTAGDTTWYRTGADYEASANPPVNFQLQPTSDFDGTVSVIVREKRATTVQNGIYIGNNVKAYTPIETGAIVIGNNAASRGSNTVTIGSAAITSTQLYGQIILAGGLAEYADDAAAAAGGIPVNGLYRTGSTIKIRVL